MLVSDFWSSQEGPCNSSCLVPQGLMGVGWEPSGNSERSQTCSNSMFVGLDPQSVAKRACVKRTGPLALTDVACSGPWDFLMELYMALKADCAKLVACKCEWACEGTEFCASSTMP